MASELRVFLIAVSPEDLADLRARASQDPALRVVGEALQAQGDHRRALAAADADVVLMSRAAAGARNTAGEALARAAPPSAPLYEELTARERDVLALVSDGYGNRVIAERLGISEHTVKFHLASIFGKLGASTRTEAVRKGLDLGIIDI